MRKNDAFSSTCDTLPFLIPELLTVQWDNQSNGTPNERLDRTVKSGNHDQKRQAELGKGSLIASIIPVSF